MVAQTRVSPPQESLQRELTTLLLLDFPRHFCYLISGFGNRNQQKTPATTGKTMARTIKVYRIAEDGRRLASGAFRAASEADLQLKWELHLATAAAGLYVATHRGVQLGMGVAPDAVRQQGVGHG
jgi:hypothetical protein